MLGICVVYLVPDTESSVLLRLSLEKLRAYTSGDFKIYGYPLRMEPDNLEILRKFMVEISDQQPESGPCTHISLEHSYYLDYLVDRAFAEGCTYVATFDPDSWPLVQDWNKWYQENLTTEIPVAAIVRSEMGDNFTLSAFTMIHNSFWRTGESSFNTQLRAHFHPDIEKMITRSGETGAGIYAQLIRDNQSFLPLYRTNTWNPHIVMCGVYGNTVFHLGAGSRKPRFITDQNEFSLNGDAIRNRYCTAVNSAKRKFYINALTRHEEEFMQSLYGMEPPLHLPAVRAGMPG